MPWSYVGVSAAATVTTTSHALTEPAGVQQGDLLVAVISSRIASTTSITLPTGGEWTLVTEQKTNNTLTTTSAVSSGMMAYCVRGASAPNLTFTHPTAPSVAMGRIVAYRGVSASSPKDTQTSTTTATNTTSVSVTGLTTALANELIVVGACGGQEAAWSAFDAVTDPTTGSGTNANQTADPIVGTWQERADSNTTTGADTSLAIADAVRGTAGATGNFTATASLGAGHVILAGAFKLELNVNVTPPQGNLTLAEPSAVVFDAQSTSVTGASAATSFSNTGKLTVGSGNNRAMLCLITWSTGTAPTGVSVTWGGTAMTLISDASAANGAGGNTALYGLLNPASGAQALAASWTGSRNYYFAGVAYTGVIQSDIASAFPRGNTNSGSGTSASVVINSASGNAAVAVLTADNAWSAVTSGTQIYLDNTGSANNGVGARIAGASPSVTLSASVASATWAAGGCDVQAASLGFAPTVEISSPATPTFLPMSNRQRFWRR